MSQSSDNYAIKQFFTVDEWDLIHSLVSNNKEFCEDEEHDPLETYTSIENKIYKLFAPIVEND